MHLAVGQEHSWMSSYANPILRPSSWAIITENPSSVIVPGYWNKESWRENQYIRRKWKQVMHQKSFVPIKFYILILFHVDPIYTYFDKSSIWISILINLLKIMR